MNFDFKLRNKSVKQSIQKYENYLQIKINEPRGLHIIRAFTWFVPI